ncbi:CDP-glycerol--glycerophosphate glycerophosphotransferase [Kineobactrum sediminis]|uniref:CDP-glycerol--glycerophosphate glycerophosphotransferase n=1 Tax=Kineobactrum sediminis TaxID=1905677 RepID=A0A2N5Y5M3_9GAMM|nr:CDP-glycerol glycerophosphotransferase family protein [Kineobactrum sediminis]PLW83672.1 CDP-glycerol--glycerophosphate glycerophosphotransferase [Kineobactrum sediminis]
MRRYLFFVNQPYAYSILRPLQAEIRKRGDEAAWFVAGCTSAPLRDDELHLRTLDEARRYPALATFVPGDWVPPQLPGIKVEVFHGLARNKRGHSSEDASDHYQIRGWFDLYCTHAETDTAKFSQLAAQHKHFAVAKTGWPKLDPLFSAGQPQGPRPRAADEPPVVFYASTFSRSITSAPVLADTIEALANSGRWRFIVTLHPKMDPAVTRRYRQMAGPNLRFVESDQELLPLLHEADLMLCDTSSIMFEFMFLNRPVVTYRTRMPGPWLLDVQDISDLEATLQRAAQRPPQLLQAEAELCRELHGFTDGASSARVLQAVDDFLASPVKRRRKPLNLLRKLRVRRRLRKALSNAAHSAP